MPAALQLDNLGLAGVASSQQAVVRAFTIIAVLQAEVRVLVVKQRLVLWYGFQVAKVPVLFRSGGWIWPREGHVGRCEAVHGQGVSQGLQVPVVVCCGVMPCHD